MIVTFALQENTGPVCAVERSFLTIKSVQRHIPKAFIVQLSNLHFPKIAGVDAVIRTDNKGDFIDWAFRSMLALGNEFLDQDILQIATDILVCQDVSDVFEKDFHVAACQYPLKDRADGAFCGDVNFIKPVGRQLWREALDIYRALPEKQRDGWEGGQTALTIAFAKTGLKVLPLDYDTYCWTPEGSNQRLDGVKIAHFRGKRKRFMKDYAERMGL